MIVGQRIMIRLPVIGISQAELARRVGMSQSGMVNLIAGRSRTTGYLHKIARHLRTTSEYLSGETDDPDVGAVPAPPAAPASVYLRVELPTEEALTEMFDALLEGIEFAGSRLEQATLLAQRLPIGLAKLHEARPAPTRKHRRAVESEDVGEGASIRPRGQRI